MFMVVRFCSLACGERIRHSDEDSLMVDTPDAIPIARKHASLSDSKKRPIRIRSRIINTKQ
ncbi:hypothetical protein C6T58_11110 [Burkholderia multivorans]|nr:hypothetical protein C6Q11_15525 [Burkholderia multivorans]PRG82428.1 hypothetical protein C6T58_11110 [Burkholderia multivorans]